MFLLKCKTEPFSILKGYRFIYENVERAGEPQQEMQKGDDHSDKLKPVDLEALTLEKRVDRLERGIAEEFDKLGVKIDWTKVSESNTLAALKKYAGAGFDTLLGVKKEGTMAILLRQKDGAQLPVYIDFKSNFKVSAKAKDLLNRTKTQAQEELSTSANLVPKYIDLKSLFQKGHNNPELQFAIKRLNRMDRLPITNDFKELMNDWLRQNGYQLENLENVTCRDLLERVCNVYLLQNPDQLESVQGDMGLDIASQMGDMIGQFAYSRLKGNTSESEKVDRMFEILREGDGTDEKSS